MVPGEDEAINKQQEVEEEENVNLVSILAYGGVVLR